jgi:outer membrane protein assembly factor BamB
VSLGASILSNGRELKQAVARALSHPLTRSMGPSAWVILVATVVVACSSTSSLKTPSAKEVVIPASAREVTALWRIQLPPMGPWLTPVLGADGLIVASSKGLVSALDAGTGKTLWSLDLKSNLLSGIGAEAPRAGQAQHFAVVTQSNELVYFSRQGEEWRYPLSVQAITTPVLAGGRVFVLQSDRSVIGLNAQNSRLLWTQQKTGDPLILNQKGILRGFSGRVLGLNPLTGATRFDTPIAVPRGVNDLERLVDLVAPAYRQGEVVCLRAFQAQIGCVNAVKGTLFWSRAAKGDVGLSGDANTVVAVESNGMVLGYDRASGDKTWESEKLRYRHLGAPLSLDASRFAVPEADGVVYLLSSEDGGLLARLSSNSQGPLAGLVRTPDGLASVSLSGSVQAYRLP